MSKRSLKSAKTSTFLISPRQLIGYGLVCKSQMTFRRISRRYSSTIFTRLTQTWYLNQQTCIRRLVQSTSHSHLFHLSLKHQCHNCKLLSFCLALRTSHLHPQTYSTWMSNLHLKSKYSPNDFITLHLVSLRFGSIVDRQRLIILSYCFLLQNQNGLTHEQVLGRRYRVLCQRMWRHLGCYIKCRKSRRSQGHPALYISGNYQVQVL